MKLRWPIPLPIVHTNQTPSDYRSSLPPPAGCWLADCCRRPVAHRPNSDASGSIQCTRLDRREVNQSAKTSHHHHTSLALFGFFFFKFFFISKSHLLYLVLPPRLYIYKAAPSPEIHFIYLTSGREKYSDSSILDCILSIYYPTDDELYIPWNNSLVALHYRWAPLQPRTSSI